MNNINFKCVLHGSFRKHFDEIKRVRKIFSDAGIEVLAPEDSEVKSIEDGFAVLESDGGKDHRMVEGLYLQNLKKLGENGFSYFVNPEGHLGNTASYELAMAQLNNVPCYFTEELKDLPVYLQGNYVWKAEDLAVYITENNKLPEFEIKKGGEELAKLWARLARSDLASRQLHEVVITAMVVRDGKYLIIRRAKDKKRFPGMWTVPGGKLETEDYINLPKDTENYWYNVLEKTLRREVAEEVNIDIDKIEYVTSLATVHGDGNPSLVISCIAQYASGEIKLQEEEADKYEWVSVEEAKDYNLIDGIYDELVMAEEHRKGQKGEWQRN